MMGTMPPVTDLTDIRVLIPRARRAIEGPGASGTDPTGGSLNDEQVTALVADAVAEAIFYTDGMFNVMLEVTERDPNYMAPVAWKLSRELSEPEQTVIMAQAALNYIFSTLSTTKTSETFKEADREWSYGLSANALQERVKTLREQRDKALELITTTSVVAETWINTLTVRDAYTDALIEPYLTSGGYLPSGQEFDPPIGP